MPELPEVETTRRGLMPHLQGRRLDRLQVHQPRLRWPVDPQLGERLSGRRIERIERRAKYLLFQLDDGACLIIHLGMSGSLRLESAGQPRRKHDHLELSLQDCPLLLRYHDPRRFGSWLWQASGELHPLLRELGPEPLEADFRAERLWRASRGRRTAVKVFLMDQSVVVGVGNIYASEALFAAGIDPRRAAGRVSRLRFERLVLAVRAVLQRAIGEGGTTLRDYLDPSGTPGYFAQSLDVYERAGLPCKCCATPIRRVVLGQRASYWCPACQR